MFLVGLEMQYLPGTNALSRMSCYLQILCHCQLPGFLQILSHLEESLLNITLVYNQQREKNQHRTSFYSTCNYNCRAPDLRGIYVEGSAIPTAPHV